MVINDPVNYDPVIRNETGTAVNNKASVFFRNTLNDIMKELENNDSSSALSSGLNRSASLQDRAQDCAIAKEEARNEDEKTAENEGKDIFTICFECENKEECEHYKKMIEGGNDEPAESVIFLSGGQNKVFHKNTLPLREQLYRLTGSSIIYNYNIICPEIDIKTKKR